MVCTRDTQLLNWEQYCCCVSFMLCCYVLFVYVYTKHSCGFLKYIMNWIVNIPIYICTINVHRSMCVWCENAKKNHMRTSTFYFRPIVAKQCYCYRCGKAELSLFCVSPKTIYWLCIICKMFRIWILVSSTWCDPKWTTNQDREGQWLVVKSCIYIAQKTTTTTKSPRSKKGVEAKLKAETVACI